MESMTKLIGAYQQILLTGTSPAWSEFTLDTPSPPARSLVIARSTRVRKRLDGRDGRRTVTAISVDNISKRYKRYPHRWALPRRLAERGRWMSYESRWVCAT
jgi:hypothetical protein